MEDSSQPTRRRFAVAAGISAAAFALRAVLLCDGLFHHDAVCVAQAVHESLRSGRIEGAGRFGGHVGGRHGLVAAHLGFHWTGTALGARWDVERSSLLAEAAFGGVSAGLFYLLTTAWCPGAGVQAALFLAISPLFLSVTTNGMGHGANLACILTAFLLAEKGRQRKWIVLSMAGGVLLGLSICLRVSNMAFALPFAITHMPKRNETARRPWSSMIRSAGAMSCLILAAAWALHVQRDWIAANAHYNRLLGIVSPVLTKALSDLVQIISPSGVVLCLIGLWFLWRQRRLRELALVLAWFVPSFMYYGNVISYKARLLSECTAILFCLMAIGLVPIRRRSLRGAMAIVALVSIGLAAPIIPALWHRHHHCGGKEFAEFVDARTDVRGIVVCLDDRPHLDFYGTRATIERPTGPPHAIAGFLKRIDALLAEARPVYVSSHAFQYDRGGAFRRALMNRYRIAPMGSIACEDYHHAALRRQTTRQEIYRLYDK